jgi:hypothetical protein
VDSDPGSLRQRIGEGTASLTATAAALTDDQASEPSLRPGCRDEAVGRPGVGHQPGAGRRRAPAPP